MEAVPRNSYLAVFCGARQGVRGSYLELAREFGTVLAERGFHLVYGAGRLGVMGALAEATRAAGGDVVGVVPHHLWLRERSETSRIAGRTYMVRSMHQRKALMYRLSAAFVALPGGIGTLDELMEVLTWNQLGIVSKPVVVVNYDGFFDPLVSMLDHLVAEGFLSHEERRIVRVADHVDDAFKKLGGTVPALTPAPSAARGMSRRRAGDPAAGTSQGYARLSG